MMGALVADCTGERLHATGLLSPIMRRPDLGSPGFDDDDSAETGQTVRMMTPRASELIGRLGLEPHPEGGFYAEVHRSSMPVDAGDGRPPRAALTAIYFLLVDRGTSRWHRVRSDEVWCHLEGSPVLLHRLETASARVTSTLLGPVSDATLPQCIVAADVWQAASSQGEYSLVACFVAPGFDFADFSLMTADDPLVLWLRKNRPDLAALV
jgi:hypothetical protein